MIRLSKKAPERLDLSIRRASLHDKEGLERLCVASVGNDDYVIPILDDVIPRQTILIALDDTERIVGMISLVKCIDRGGWLGMARTHPHYRRQGVASALIRRFIELATQVDMPCLRLWTDHDNAAANATAKTLGFREIGRFVRVNGPASAGRVRAAVTKLDERLWAVVQRSTISAMGSRYFCHDWCFVPATRSVLAAIGAKGQLHAWDANVLTFAAERDRLTDELEFSPLAGKPSELLQEARRQARRLGCENASSFIPSKRSLILDAKKAGFKLGHWGRVAVLYELTISTSD